MINSISSQVIDGRKVYDVVVDFCAMPIAMGLAGMSKSQDKIRYLAVLHPSLWLALYRRAKPDGGALKRLRKTLHEYYKIRAPLNDWHGAFSRKQAEVFAEAERRKQEAKTAAEFAEACRWAAMFTTEEGIKAAIQSEGEFEENRSLQLLEAAAPEVEAVLQKLLEHSKQELADAETLRACEDDDYWGVGDPWRISESVPRAFVEQLTKNLEAVRSNPRNWPDVPGLKEFLAET